MRLSRDHKTSSQWKQFLVEKWRTSPGPDPGPGSDRSNGNENEQMLVPSHTTERRLMAKIDLRLIPCLSILYLFAFLDR